MDRLKMLRQAVKFAHEQIDDATFLSDKRHKTLNALSDENAVKRLTRDILKEAAYNTETDY